MTNPAEIPDPAASRAVLIGVSKYDVMQSLPAVANNLRRLKALLTAHDVWGLPKNNCTVLLNPRSNEQVLDAVHTAAAEAEEALFVYFSGHGLVSRKGDLYLALSSSHLERIYSGASYDLLRHELVGEATARSRMVILDCCYSGAAMDGYMGPDADVAERAVVEGTYVMTAAAETKQALAPPGEEYTAFTGELVRALDEGVPGGPDPLSMDALFRHVRRELVAKDRPRPQQRARNGGGAVALTRNRWVLAQRRLAEEAERQARLKERAGKRAHAAEETPSRGWMEWAQWGWEKPRPSFPRRRPRFLRRMLGSLLPADPRLRSPVQGALALALVGSLLAGCLYVAELLGPGECAKGVREVSGECIGVTDGSYEFAANLTDISGMIQRENNRVRLSGNPSVAIALMTPMTAVPSENDEESQDGSEAEEIRIRHKLVGAYLAQRRANSRSEGSMIRLLLANTGTDGADWRPVVDRLVALAKGRQNLRAVTGLDSGHDATHAAARELSRHGIPMVSSAPAAVSLLANDGDNPVRDLARVLPSLTEQVQALVSVPDMSSKGAALVWDKTPGDLYSQSLYRAFSAVADTSPSRMFSYTAPTNEEPTQGLEDRLYSIAHAICREGGIETVYYAGRPLPLRSFLSSLGRKLNCGSKKLHVISGPGAAALATDKRLAPFEPSGNGEIKVSYPTALHPEAWRTGSAPETGGSARAVAELRELTERGFRRLGGTADNRLEGTADHTDGSLVATYDATLTAITGIRHVTGKPGEIPSLGSVGAVWPTLNGRDKVEGASGWICLDDKGRPWNKAVPIGRLTFDRSGAESELLTVAWPEGEPPDEYCLPPNPP